MPHLGLDVHALDRLPRKYVGVRAVANGHDMCVISEDFVCDWIDQIAFAVAESGAEGIRACIAREIESYEVLLMQLFAVDRVLVRVLV